MECNICSRKFSRGSILDFVGFVCQDPECITKAKSQQDEYLHECDEFVSYLKMGIVPDPWGAPEFEKFSVGLARMILAHHSGTCEEGKVHWFSLDDIALHIKSCLLKRLREYTSTIEARGHERLLFGGKYRFFRSVPTEVMLDACRKEGFIE